MMNNVERYNHKTVIHSKTTFELRNELNNFSFDRRIKGKNDQKTFINAHTKYILYYQFQKRYFIFKDEAF